jgi:predicted NUDIX family NTP pyrophosphohydrolase
VPATPIVVSAGILLHRWVDGELQVLVGHHGGPLWARKDAQAWSAPKGEVDTGEDLLAAARREFTEELGLPVPQGDWRPLGEQRQRSGKLVVLWTIQADLDVDAVAPGTFTMQWPPRSGRLMEFPEIDRVQWFAIEVARTKLVAGQVVFLDRLVEATARG